MNIIIGLIVLGFIIWLALALFNLFFTLIVMVLAGIIASIQCIVNWFRSEQ